MLEQKICTVQSENTIDGTTLRFGPLGNKSHIKQLHKEIGLDAHKILEEAQKNNQKLLPNEATELAYNKVFPTLQMLNLEGWKLESFAIIYDSNELRLQVAIFSRETS